MKTIPAFSTLLITSKASDALYLIVSDDAGGMGEERSLPLCGKSCAKRGENRTGNPEAYSADHGLGLVNIHQRIRIYYGESYGLTVDSRPGRALLSPCGFRWTVPDKTWKRRRTSELFGTDCGRRTADPAFFIGGSSPSFARRSARHRTPKTAWTP